MNKLINFELRLEYNVRALLFKIVVPSVFFGLQYTYAHLFRISPNTLTIENFQRETSALFFQFYIPILTMIFAYRFSRVFSTGFFAHIIGSTRSKLNFFLIKSISHIIQMMGLTLISLALTTLIYVQVPEPDPFQIDLTMFNYTSFVIRSLSFTIVLSAFSLLPVMWFRKQVHLLVFLYIYPQIEILLPQLERFTGTSIFMYSPINVLAGLKEGDMSGVKMGFLVLYFCLFYVGAYRLYLFKKK